MIDAGGAMRLMRVIAFFCSLSCSFSIPAGRQYLMQNPNPYYRLEAEESGECIFQKSREGEYTFVSTGSDNVCALYVSADPDYVIELQILRFDISCTKGGLLTVFDGWEHSGQFFPSPEDHPKPMDQRFAEYCGPIKPRKPFATSQNVGAILYRVPTRGNYFSVLVTFRRNPKRCNVFLNPLSTSPVYTIRNYGRRVNCSAVFIYPMNLRILATSIGTQGVGASPSSELETGLITKCEKRGMTDFAEFMGGNGLDTATMLTVGDVCGLDSTASSKAIQIPCGTTAVRLVASGRYEDSLTFGYEPIIEINNFHICSKDVMAV
ncbi:corticotropin-releasing factor-binding protein-like [Ornithodoros turicata]|uniref:corticotropin-releasing factor-binding protein-like n=1 Tax=Ornithodoros turicata TaxID=34597 RepID=UPI003138E3B5